MSFLWLEDISNQGQSTLKKENQTKKNCQVYFPVYEDNV